MKFVVSPPGGPVSSLHPFFSGYWLCSESKYCYKQRRRKKNHSHIPLLETGEYGRGFWEFFCRISMDSKKTKKKTTSSCPHPVSLLGV